MVYVEFDSVTTRMESECVCCRRRKPFYWNTFDAVASILMYATFLNYSITILGFT